MNELLDRLRRYAGDVCLSTQTELDAACEIERLRVEVVRLRASVRLQKDDIDELHALTTQLSELLERTANALKGEPKSLLQRHSFHDLPELATALKADLDTERRLSFRSQIEQLETVVDAARGVLRYDGIDKPRQRIYIDRLDAAVQAYITREAPDHA
jgi:hypothetical protein